MSKLVMQPSFRAVGQTQQNTQVCEYIHVAADPRKQMLTEGGTKKLKHDLKSTSAWSNLFVINCCISTNCNYTNYSTQWLLPLPYYIDKQDTCTLISSF